MKHKCKKKLLHKLEELKGIWFHIIGIICLFWFLIRVLPAPHRSQYPCQQISIPIALGYIAFWTAMLSGLTVLIKKVKRKTYAFLPTILVLFILIFSISSMVFAGNYLNDTTADEWTPVANEPIGIPKGVNPGRVVWIWDPDATESELNGYWWFKKNNNQQVLDKMCSRGIKELAGVEDNEEAWDLIFRYFNQIHGFGDNGYQTGEKIAIKVNLNNCWDWCKEEYTEKDNERDANPYVIKSLLRQLTNIAGVDQEDITVYDASRKMSNWLYRRVYYKEFPALPLVVEFPDVNFVDSTGGSPGRQQVEASNQKIFFADGTGLYRTLPTCVIDAKYIINMPLLKRHPIKDGVTLSGKNFFGTFIEPVEDLHEYHEAAFIEGNPAPQVDLLAHEQIGQKTILNIGDGTYPTKIDHRTIDKFQMYPFNDDWTNSLFFSQDPVAIDSVMFDFLYAEGTNPVEGSQNYMHQAAQPLDDIYDPENDGEFLNFSLGVHEHWNTSVSIFSSERYSGLLNNGIDYIAIGEENAESGIIITQPKQKTLYINGVEKRTFPTTLIIGDINVETRINGIDEEIEKVEFYIDEELQHTDNKEPYTWELKQISLPRHHLKTIVYYGENNILSDEMIIWKFF